MQVLDVNDNIPEFQPSPSLSEQAYVVSVEEGSNTLNETILDVNATDKDFGRNADILYSMSGDSNGYFSVNHVTVCRVAEPANAFVKIYMFLCIFNGFIFGGKSVEQCEQSLDSSPLLIWGEGELLSRFKSRQNSLASSNFIS